MRAGKLLSWLFVALFLWFGVVSEAFAKPKPDARNRNETETITYVVQKGDTVDKISRKYHVTADDIVRWNRLADAAHIRIGQKLHIRVPRGTSGGNAKPGHAPHASRSDDAQYSYVVKKGDSLAKIAKKTGVSVEDLKRNNPALKKNPNRLRVGQRIVLRVRRFEVTSGQSHGLPNNGLLTHGIELKPGKGYKIQRQKRSYGTALTVGTLMDAFDAFMDKYPSDPGFVVGDLSAEGGGYLSPHLSHQSGRDVDISYIAKNASKAMFQKMNADNFDAERNWYFIDYLLRTKKLVYIFVDYELQKLLYAQALKRGYTEESLREVMQYPRSISNHVGIIRHARGHADHLHVRFVCQPGDKDCR